MGSHAGIAGTLGIAQPDEAKPRLTLEPARCAVGISRSGAVLRVVHTLSGKELGIVAEVYRARWCFACPQGCSSDGADGVHVWNGISLATYPSADAAATALSAHDLDHKLSAIRDRLALAAGGEVA